MTRRARRVTVTWMYGGVRAGDDGRARHAWIDESGFEQWLPGAGKQMRGKETGRCYQVEISRHPHGQVTVHRVAPAQATAAPETRAALLAAHDQAPALRKAAKARHARRFLAVLDRVTAEARDTSPSLGRVVELLFLRTLRAGWVLRRRQHLNPGTRDQPPGGPGPRSGGRWRRLRPGRWLASRRRR